MDRALLWVGGSLARLRAGKALWATSALVSLLWSVTARADTPFDGKWKQGALREDYTVAQWTPTGCGPPPISGASGGGEIVSIHQEGDELAIAGAGRVFRTNQCYDEQPTLARETHSRDPSGRSWRTRCSTPANDPRHATMNTLVIATSDTHIDVIETGRYELMVDQGKCIADVRRSREFDLVSRDLAAPAASASAVIPTPLPTVAAIPPPTHERPSCDAPGEPARLEVRPSRKLLRTGESTALRAVVVDANGCATGTATSWSIAPGGGTTLSVDGTGRVSAPVDAAEGSGQVLVTAAGLRSRVTIDVASPAHYDELLVSSGLDLHGENDTPAVAETGSIGGADARAEDTAKKRRTTFLVILAVLALAMGVVAWVFARRQKRAAQLEKSAEREYEAKLREADALRSEKRAAHEAAVKAHEDSLRRARDAASRRSAAEARAGEQTARSAEAIAMLCPTCRQEYPLTSAFCPQDATKLIPMGNVQGAPQGGGSICPACKRGFPTGTRVCPHDGEELVPYAMHAAVARAAPLGTGTVAMTGRGKICPTCGGRFDGAAAFCGKDGTALVLLN